jgi:hypothetical protein
VSGTFDGSDVGRLEFLSLRLFVSGTLHGGWGAWSLWWLDGFK